MHVGERKFYLYGMKLLPQVIQVLLLCGATSTEKAHFNLSATNLSYYQLEGSSFIVPWSKINQNFLNALPSWRCNGFCLDDSKKHMVILQRLVCSTRQHHPATTLLCWMHHSFRRVVQNGIVYVAKFVGGKMVTARKLLLTSVKCYQSNMVQAHIKSRNQTELSITIQQYSSMDEFRCRYHLLTKKNCCQSRDAFAWGQAKLSFEGAVMSHPGWRARSPVH